MVTLIGYFGRNNFGDELMLSGVLELLQNKSKYKLISKNSRLYEALYGIETIESTSLIKRLKLYFFSKKVIWIGGTCLYSNKGLLSLFKNFVIAKCLMCEFHFIGVGIGRINNKIDRLIIILILKYSNSVILRDEESIKVGYKLTKKVFSKIPDLAYLKLSKIHYRNPQTKKTKIIVNLISNEGVWWERTLINKLAEISTVDDEIILVPGEMQQDSDLKALLAFYKNYKYLFKNIKVFKWSKFDEVIELFKEGKYYIGMRLHFFVLADHFQIPSIAIEYSPKISFYNKEEGGDYHRIISKKMEGKNLKFASLVNKYNCNNKAKEIERLMISIL